jgi:hypothetical protein
MKYPQLFGTVYTQAKLEILNMMVFSSFGLCTNYDSRTDRPSFEDYC